MEGFCRGCLIKYDDPMELLQYTEKYRRLFVYSTGLQVKRNDTITFQICKDCFLNMKAACKFKKSCRMSDKKLKNYLALKEFEGDVDFCTFLKNSYDSTTFRLPLMSGCSTPANYKGRDDDNESTCTSIRNFMTDILEGEEVPDTEARIIREVIEEEADVLDDSLDSHWLQDDASIDTDFRLDFSFSPFATPHSVNNDHCYTPKTYTDQTEKQGQLKKYFTSISPARQHKVNDFTDIIKRNQSEKELCIYDAEEINHEEHVDKFDMPMTGSAENNFESPLINDGQSCNNLDIPSIDSERLINNLDLPMIDNEKSISNSDLPMIDNDKSTNNLDLSMIDNNKTIDNLEPPVIDHDKPNSNLEPPVIDHDKPNSNLDIPSLDSERLINNLDLSINDNEMSMNNLDIPSFYSEKSINNLDLPSLPSIDNERSITNFDVPIIENANAKHFYMSNDNTDYITTSKEIERIVDGKVIQRKEKDKPCIIDQNLEKALEDENNKKISLDDLLVTPKVFPDASTASTPTITNILFGDKLELNDNSTDNSKKYMEKIDNIEIFEEFFQSSTKDSVKEENIDETKNYFKVPMDVDEVDTGTEEIPKKENILSVYDENQCDLENFFCNLCNKKFGSSKALSIHFMKKHKIKIIKKKNKYLYDKHRLCNICGKEYKDSRSFHGHMKKHKLALQKESSIFKCELCTLEFSSQSKLNKHIAAHNGTSTIKKPGKFICTVCGAASTSIGNLRHHQKRHTMNYMHKCEHCGKGFYRKSDLTVHERLHTGEKPYQCSFCDRLFSRKDSLTKHMKHHIGNRPFECEHCKVTFTTKSQLNVHLRISVKCRKLRGLLDDKGTIETDLAEPKDKNKTSETNTQSVANNIKPKSQLPYIDTEMSN